MNLLNRMGIILLLISLSIGAMAQQGTVTTAEVVQSKILGRDMSYSVYLPPGYETSNRPYPVLYLLHGMTGNHVDWAAKGEVRSITDKAISSGEAPEMIIIMPDGLFDAFYINNYDKSIRWEDFFYEEFIPQVEKKYRIMADRNTRAISGLSMGGYGALYHSMKHKEMFRSVYAMSAAVLEVEPLKKGEEPSGFNREFNLKTWGPTNKEGLPTNYKVHSVHEMIKSMEPYQAPNPFMGGGTGLPQIFIDCGDDDFLLKQNTNLVHLMKEKNVPFEFRVRDGGHTWEYWRTGLAMALKFVGDSFRN